MSELRILVLAEEGAGGQALNAIARCGHKVVAVMTSAGESNSVAAAAHRYGYDIWPASDITDLKVADRIRSERVDLLFNVHSRHIIKEPILQAARIGSFNMHPGPLPEYAGLNCVSWAIYRGVKSYGVTLHWMTRIIDAGAVAYRHDFPIEDNDTPVSLTHKCVKFGVPLILKLIDVASQDPSTIPSMPQDLTRREYFDSRIPEGGRLSWNRRAGEIVDFVRACDYAPFYSPWGLPKASCENREIFIVKADRTHQKCDVHPGVVGRCDPDGTLIATADEWVSIRQLKIDGQSVKPYTALKSGLVLQDGV
ncbi:MAG TPA: formyltransferase family protein [Terriglobia bacterium]|nr:formyltransferase family protein [Terriglobia bacterium]